MRRTWWRPGVTIPGLVLSVLIGLALGLAVFTFGYGEGASYLSNDPRSCANCHIMRDEYDSWQKSSHHGAATCNDCHAPHDFLGKWLSKASNGFWHSKAFTLQDFHEPIRIKPRNAAVLQANCIDCHGTLVHDITTLGSAGEPGNNCVRCHIGVGHGPAR